MKKKIELPSGHRKIKKKALNFLASITSVFFVSQLHAADVETKIGVTGGVAYDSNPAMTSSHKDPVWIFTLAPNLQLNIKDDVNLWYLDGALSVQRHSNEMVLVNREDPRVVAGWTHTYESGLLGAKASYMKNSSLINQLVSAGVFTQTNNTETSKELAANWQQSISSRWNVLTDAFYRQYEYSVITPGGLISYNVADIRSKLSYENSEKLITHAQVGYEQVSPNTTFGNTDKVHLIMSADYKFNDDFDYTARAGVYNLSGRQSNTDWTGGIVVNYTNERMKYSLGLNRDNDPSGLGGFQTSDSLKLGWGYVRSERDHFGVDYSLSKYRKNATIGLGAVDYQQITGFYERSLSSNLQANLSASYKKINTNTTNGDGSYIGVTFVYDKFIF